MQRKEPLTDAQRVRNAVARFDQVIGVSDTDRALAFVNIEKAASHYIDLSETSRRDLGVHPQRNRKALKSVSSSEGNTREFGYLTKGKILATEREGVFSPLFGKL
jgi:hypothetical protein